jgi:hypothetical protein
MQAVIGAQAASFFSETKLNETSTLTHASGTTRKSREDAEGISFQFFEFQSYEISDSFETYFWELGFDHVFTGAHSLPPSSDRLCRVVVRVPG